MKAFRVYGYTRVSTEEQARGGVSLEMQAERIRAYCDSQGWTLARIFEDAGHSGTTLRRPALQELLTRLDGIDRTQTMVAFQQFSAHDLEAMFGLGLEDKKV